MVDVNADKDVHTTGATTALVLHPLVVINLRNTGDSLSARAKDSGSPFRLVVYPSRKAQAGGQAITLVGFATGSMGVSFGLRRVSIRPDKYKSLNCLEC
ncbi:hypothetical protein K504DRAFT_459112 [Pleomassaria siparia CBS 279.74]|uniref:Uncharacterized protein n=1 Tax=Pleomassaria siparia CBS 279.74 TaxID=1314801 RepID=A0A6G1K267_9PLEO|nr:hypothetical protein K504DRAFT_459112 [Pleomassaria siparia CBS 279.74]